MKRYNLEAYAGSPWAAQLWLAEAKAGKTTWLIGQALGVWPGQQHGGIVTHPSHLHVVALDMQAVRGVLGFLRRWASPEVGKVDVWDLEADAQSAISSDTDWDLTMYNALLNAYTRIHALAKPGEVHVLMTSSLTGAAAYIQRALFGRPGLGDKKGSGGDMAKNDALNEQLAELRRAAQADGLHCWWEGHVTRTVAKTQNGQPGEERDDIGLRGKTGHTFAFNVGQVFRLRRFPGQREPSLSVPCDKVQVDTKPTLSFFQGRDFHLLNPLETDIGAMYKKLGYAVGGWRPGAEAPGAKPPSAKPAAPSTSARRPPFQPAAGLPRKP